MRDIDLFNTKEELDEQEQKAREVAKKLEVEQRKKVLKDRINNEENLKRVLPPLPDKKYQIIYIDPPWKYSFSRSISREIENQYPTMELEDIKKLSIGDLAEDDSILFLWATSPKLEEAFEVLNAYGFKYVTNGIWNKRRMGMGYYFRGIHELLLIGKKGALPVPKPENRPASIIGIRRTKHSRKPVEFYKIIENMYPGTTKIEIFSRISREGWDTWGFEEGVLSAPEYAKLWKEGWEA